MVFRWRVIVAPFAVAAAVWFAAPASGKAAAEVRLESIRVQFLYQTTGALSEDLVRATDFAIWNTIIGEGSAKEPAEDLLVSAVLASPSEEAITGTLVLTVTGGEGRQAKVLGRHTFNGVLMQKGQLVQSILLHHATCAGALTAEATYGTQRQIAKVHMDCGE